MCHSSTEPRLVLRKEVKFSETGQAEVYLDVPQGYRVVSSAFALPDDGRTGVTLEADFPTLAYQGPGLQTDFNITRWYWFVLVNSVDASAGFILICERSTEPDVTVVVDS